MGDARQRRVSLFRNGRNQAVRIPREYELEGDEALLYRDGNQLVIEPLPKGGLLEVLNGLEALDEAFPDVDGTLPAADDIRL